MIKDSAVLFVHGGPGLSSSYFKPWFDALTNKYDLLFYDQNYNIPENKTAIEALTEELYEKIHYAVSNYKKVVLFVHSWGVFVMLNVFYNYAGAEILDKLDKIILSNPSDSNWAEFCNSGDKLFAKMSQEEMNAISACSNGVQLMKLAMPYYVGSTEHVPNIAIDRYDMVAYDRISSEMEGYDIGYMVDSLPLGKVYTIYCENDFEQPIGSPELYNKTKVFSFKSAGHFPFAEYPQEYFDLLRGIL